MSIRRDDSESDFSQFMHMDPFYDSEQCARYQRIKQASEQLEQLSKLVGNYIAMGRKYSASILDLYDGINKIDQVIVNPQYSSLSDTFVAMNMILMNHLNHVETAILAPVKSFMKHDLSSMRKAKNDYFSVNDKFTEMNDKMVSKQQGTDKKKKIMDLHRQSSHSFCEYVLQLDVTESRYNNLIGSLLSSYASFVGEEQADQMSQLYQKKKNEIEIVLENIRKSNENITAKMFESTKAHNCVDSQMNNYYSRLDSPFTHAPSTSIQGYLWKKPGHFGLIWEKLFCMCKDGFFAASSSPATCARPLWTQQLVYCDVKPIDIDDKPNCFTIVAKDKSIVLQAPSLHDKQKWIATIQNSKASLFQTEQSHETQHKSTNKCADCGAEGAEWIITNRGALVCEQCAGIHRSYAASISRIKSLTMDTIDLYCKELLHKLGNDAINSILEANVVGKITYSATREEREAFIRKKYIEKAFITTEKLDLTHILKSQNLVGLLHCILDGSINQTLNGGLTALHAAAIIGSPLMTTLIATNCPSMVNQTDSHNWNGLMYACFYNHLYVVDSLLLFGADPSMTSAVKPYIIAASKKHNSIAQKLSQFRPESFEIMTGDAPTTEFHPKDVDLSPFLATIPEVQTPRPEKKHNRRSTIGPHKRPNL